MACSDVQRPGAHADPDGISFIDAAGPATAVAVLRAAEDAVPRGGSVAVHLPHNWLGPLCHGAGRAVRGADLVHGLRPAPAPAGLGRARGRGRDPRGAPHERAAVIAGLGFADPIQDQTVLVRPALDVGFHA